MKSILALLLLLPTPAVAQMRASVLPADAPAETMTLLPAATAAAALGGAAGYWIGLRWRFLGSAAQQADQREAPLLGALMGGLASAAAACLRTASTAVTTQKCLDGAVIGTVPAVAIAGGAAYYAPRRLRPFVAAVVYGFLEGGVTAWVAAKE